MHAHMRPRAEPPSALAVQRRAAPVSGEPRVPRRGRGTDAGSPAAALVVRGAGNRAVAGLVRSLQRSPDSTKPQANVAGTGITRLEVHGLRFGVSGFRSSYDGEASDEANKTSESPDHMAVVLVPDKLDPSQPVQLILHFHGWGFRFDKNAHDPYAGYLVAKGGAGRPPAGTVRDVDQEHWEQQIAGLRGQGPQVVTILAQGRGMSDFGNFPTFEYVRGVLLKSGHPGLVTVAKNERYTVVLSAHSGGGSKVIRTIMTGGEAETAQRTALAPQDLDRRERRVLNRLQPVDLVVLYEAINVPQQTDLVMAWIDRQLDRLGAALAKTPDKAADALAATPVLRGYYGRRNSGYAVRYCDLACRIEKAIQAKIPEPRRQAAADRFRVIEVTGPAGGEVGHEQVISGVGAAASTGSLSDALRAQRDPKSDRAQAVGCDACQAELKAWREQERKRAKAKPAKAPAGR